MSHLILLLLRHLFFLPFNEFHSVELGGAGCVEGMLQNEVVDD